MIKLAVVGATGLVGHEMLKVLEEFNFPAKQLFFCASEKSVGKTIQYKRTDYKISSVE